MIYHFECDLCTFGKYCADAGMTTYSGSCDGGYYCYSDNSTLTWTDDSGSPVDIIDGWLSTEAAPAGKECAEGTWCPSGSYLPEKCPPGMQSRTDDAAPALRAS